MRTTEVLGAVTIAGKKHDMSTVLVWDKVADAMRSRDWKDMKELNMVYQTQGRCLGQGLYSWCPADDEWLFKYLGIE